MSKSFLSIVSVVFCAGIFLFTACKDKESAPTPDKCTGVNCENGGLCQDGTCACPRGYEGTTCADKWTRRYVGSWEFEEKIIASSEPLRVDSTTEYVAMLSDEKDNALRFFINGFMDNGNYNGISCEIGLNNKRAYEPPTKFIFTPAQAVAGSNYSITMGSGTVNDNGNFMTGEYHRTGLVNAQIVIDTVAFRATLKQ